MQILGKRSKVLLIAVAIAMLVAIGISFAAWDSMSAVKAMSGNSSTYANAKVGDIIEFGQYYQTGNRINNDANAEYEKTPIEWIVVDKDERTGQLTLMSKNILASGSYFANFYFNAAGDAGHHYNASGEINSEVDNIPYNQAYVDSTARAFLNNLERRDMGGDSYVSREFKTSVYPSDKTTGKLYASIGFSNRAHHINNLEYSRPIASDEYKNRPATRGFYDEAFSDNEKAMIVPKAIAGYTGFRWPNNTHEPSEKAYVEGTVDKVWLASASELNIMIVNDDNYTNPSDEASSTVFEYFKNYNQYKNPLTNITNNTLADALKTEKTSFVDNNSKAMNYGIPVYKYQSTMINDDIHLTKNSSNNYWTRSPMSCWYGSVRVVDSLGLFVNYSTNHSNIGVRPCVMLKY